MGATVNPSIAHAELIATFKRAEADAAHKFGLIKAAANKGPKAIQAATETAAKAAKRRDSFAKKLGDLGGTSRIKRSQIYGVTPSIGDCSQQALVVKIISVI